MDGMVLNAETRAYQKYLQTLQPGHIKNDSKTARALSGKKGFDENRFRFGDFRKTLNVAADSVSVKSQRLLETNKSSTVKDAGKADGTTSELSRISVENMTMDEYKAYIRQKIYALPVNSTQVLNSVAVDITDEGFAAMKDNPEYEEWVLGTLRVDFATTDPWSGITGGRYVIHHFGASKEEYRGESWNLDENGGMGQSIFNAEAKKSFWQRRTDSIQSYLKAQELMDLQQRRLERLSGFDGDYDSMGGYSSSFLQNLRRLYYAGYNTNVK